jgi:hypothetical protein
VEWGLPDRHEERSLTPLIYEYQVINLVCIVLLDLADDFRSSFRKSTLISMVLTEVKIVMVDMIGDLCGREVYWLR